jgi:hypothetical protein
LEQLLKKVTLVGHPEPTIVQSKERSASLDQESIRKSLKVAEMLARADPENKVFFQQFELQLGLLN